jgi:hypothetical protein
MPLEKRSGVAEILGTDLNSNKTLEILRFKACYLTKLSVTEII